MGFTDDIDVLFTEEVYEVELAESTLTVNEAGSPFALLEHAFAGTNQQSVAADAYRQVTYVNDITYQDTQVLMEYATNGSLGSTTTAYSLGMQRESFIRTDSATNTGAALGSLTYQTSGTYYYTGTGSVANVTGSAANVSYYGFKGDSLTPTVHVVKDSAIYGGNDIAYHLSTNVAAGLGDVAGGLAVVRPSVGSKPDGTNIPRKTSVVSNSTEPIVENPLTDNAVDLIDDFYTDLYNQQRDSIPEYENYLDILAGNKEGVPDNAYTIANYIQENGGTMVGYKGGRVYQNIPSNVVGQTLPQVGVYKEYDINPYIRGIDRGAERIVIGEDGSVWYTSDHYLSFIKIK